MPLNAYAITGIGIQKPDDFVQNRSALFQVQISTPGFEQRTSRDANDDFGAVRRDIHDFIHGFPVGDMLNIR